jgi:hypothetical protein
MQVHPLHLLYRFQGAAKQLQKCLLLRVHLVDVSLHRHQSQDQATAGHVTNTGPVLTIW